METSGIEEWYVHFQEQLIALQDSVQSIVRTVEKSDAVTGGLVSIHYDLERVLRDVERQRDWLADYRRWLVGEKHV